LSVPITPVPSWNFISGSSQFGVCSPEFQSIQIFPSLISSVLYPTLTIYFIAYLANYSINQLAV